MRERSRRAFSLVELLIVITIVLLLAGISLTGLQAARESARRLSCAANLRELGLGLLHYHEALGVLPPSWGGPDSTSTHEWGSPLEVKPFPFSGVGLASGFVMLLPYIGESNVWAAIESARWPFIHHGVYASARMPVLLCPSDPSARSHNYLFSIGDRYRGFWTSSQKPPAEDATFQSNLRGLFGLQSRVRLGAVRDGLSHTIALSECVKPKGLGRTVPADETVDGVRYYGHREAVVNDRHAVSFSYQTPAECLASFADGRFEPGTTLLVVERSPGWQWSIGWPAYVSFSTVLPPNAPRCSDMETRGSLTPQSLHPGGVFGLMADGAVRFIADDIDAGDPSLPDRQAGPSPYGVWGALGSRAGAEVASLPLP
jgi:prepilin-type N-terminal cleavage/methylation domain-containing protein